MLTSQSGLWDSSGDIPFSSCAERTVKVQLGQTTSVVPVQIVYPKHSEVVTFSNCETGSGNGTGHQAESESCLPRSTAMWQHRCARTIELECGHEKNSKHCSQTPATRRGEEAITATDLRQSATFRFVDFGL